MQLPQYTVDLLNDIESRIIPEVEDDFISQYQDFWNCNFKGLFFSPKRKIVSEPKVEIKKININDAIADPILMLDAQLGSVSAALSKTGGALTMRANYGTGILSSLFGAEIFIMPYSANTLPTTRSLNDTDKIKAIIDKGMPSLTNGLGKNVFEFGELCLEIFKNYPKISKYLFMYHPDTQGPLDIAELLWGGEMFYALYDEPEFVHSFLQLITDTYCAFLDKWFELYPVKKDLNAHWHFLMKGAICIRNDSAMNLSPEMYNEFAFPYDSYLLKRYNGGIVHFCGRGDHYIKTLASAPMLYGINLSQPHLNDMPAIYDALFTNNIRMLGFDKGLMEEYSASKHAKPAMILL